MKSWSHRGRIATLVVCLITTFVVAGCGSSSVSSQVKNKIVTELTGSGVSKSVATKVMNCFVPTLKAHHIYTLSDGKAFGNNAPSWATSALTKCATQAGLHL